MARTLRRGFAAALLCLAFVAGIAPEASAQTLTPNPDGSYTVPAGWALSPGSAPDTKFRLMFITSTSRNLQSPHISRYNSHVQDAAAAGHAAIRPYSSLFRAVASTATRDARDNTGTTGTGVPIYWLNGTNVANDYADFYDGSWDFYIRRDENGAAIAYESIATGSLTNGTKSSSPLGSATSVSVGLPQSGSDPIGGSSTVTPGTSKKFYALSPVFKTAPGVFLSAADYTAREGETFRATIVMTSPRPVPTTLEVHEFGGVATSGTDYEAGPYTVIIPAGETEGYVDIPITDDNVLEPDRETFLLRLFNPDDPGVETAYPESAVVRIDDNDSAPAGPTITIERYQTPDEVTEGGRIGFKLTTDRLPERDPLTVWMTITEPEDSDFAQLKAFSGVKKFRASFVPSQYTGTQLWRDGNGVDRKNILELWFSTADDDVDEPSGRLTVTVDAGEDYRVGSRSSFSVRVRDDDLGAHDGGAPCLQCVWVTSGGDVVEGGTATFTLHAYPPPKQDLRVLVNVYDAPGETGAKFLRGGHKGEREIVIPGGQGATGFQVPTQDDATDEQDAYISAQAVGSIARAYGPVDHRYRARRDSRGMFGRTEARVTVQDNDDPPVLTRAENVSFTLSHETIREDAADPWVNVDVSLSKAQNWYGAYLYYHVCVFSTAKRSRNMGQTGANGYDYRLWGWLGERNAEGERIERILTGGCPSGKFERGETRSRMRIEILDDSHEDSGETIRLVLQRSNSVHWENLGIGLEGQLSRTLVILNDEGGPRLAGHPLVKYASLAADIRDVYILDHDNDGAHTKWKRVLKGLGDPAYAAYGQAAMTAAEARDIYDTHGWSRWEPVGEALAYAEAYFSGTTTPPPASDPEVTIAAGDGVTEGTSATFTLTADPAPSAALDVSVTVATDGDYGITAGTQTVTIPTTGSATLTLATTGDEADEADGSVSVTVDAGDGYSVGTPSSGSVAIADDDDPAPETGETSTGAHPAVDPALIAQIREWMKPQGPNAAARNERFTRVLAAFGVESHANPMTVAEAEGYVRRGWGTRWQPIVDALKAIEAYVVPPTPDTTADPAPVPEVTIAAGDGVTEGTAASFTLTADPAPSAPLDVTVTVAASGDYGITAGQRTVTVPTSGSYTLTLATTGDEADEADGSVSVTVDAGTGYTVGAASSGTVAIADDDLPPPAVSVTAGAGVTEGGNAVFTVKADRAVDADLAVTLTVSEKAGSDFVAAAGEGEKTVTILDGETEATLTVKTVDDAAVEPDGSVTATVGDGTGYTAAPSPANAASVAVADNDAAASVPTLSIDDATGPEGKPLVFIIRLSAPSDKPVRLSLKTRESTPVSARANRDFFGGYYPVTFRPGQTVQRRSVYIHDDSHDDGGETFEVYISWADAPVSDGVAVGTITNDDPLPGAWLARFGRAVAERAVDGITARMAADRTPGLRGSIAGQALDFGEAATDPSQVSGAGPGSLSPGSLSGTSFSGETPAEARGMTMQEVLRGSSFSLTGEADSSGGTLSFWGGTPGSGGLVSGSQFSGDQRGDGTAIGLHGETATALLGTDYARGRWLVGFALSETRAEGGYAAIGGNAEEGDGAVEASLTATIPYAALAVTDRLRLWGAAGQGAGDVGDVTVKTALGESLRADTAWSMAAAGLRGDLLAPSFEGTGPSLALVSDAMWVRTSSEKTSGLAASESDVSRLRLGLEGSWSLGTVTPRLELGARHDGGDAETGFGVELGGGLAWHDPKLGLRLDLSGRTLVAHDDGALEDRGISAQLAYDPAPASGRGLSLSLGQDWGGRAQGGLDALFQPEPLEDRQGSDEALSRWSMEAAWGLPVLGNRFTGSPWMGLGLAAGARDYSLGWRLTPEAAGAPNLSFGLKATRRESDNARPEHIIGVELSTRW